MSITNVNINRERNIPLRHGSRDPTGHDQDGQQTRTHIRQLTTLSLCDTTFSRPADIELSIADGRNDTPASDSDGGTSDSGGCETSERLARCQRET